MVKKLLLLTGSIVSLSLGSIVHANTENTYAVTNCNGTQVVRVAVGRFEVRHVESNLPGCVDTASSATSTSVNTTNTSSSLSQAQGSGTSVVTTTSTSGSMTGTTVTPNMEPVINCNGLQVIPLSNGGYALAHVEPNLPGCIETNENGEVVRGQIDLSHGPLLDLTSRDIIEYRLEQLRQQKIKFANALRSLRIRRAASMKATTEAYLMRNDAVVVEREGNGWVGVQGAELSVTNTQENTVEAQTEGRAQGYSVGKYLRDPNINDLVRIEQADHAYWSDIAHINAGMVNVRAHPWYTAPIVTTLRKGAMLYIVATVDNWSEVRNDEGSIQGYVRSDLLTVDQAQRVDNPDTYAQYQDENEEPTESSWIGF